MALYPFYFEHIVPNGRRALVYRDDHGREVQEIEIVLDDGRVATVQRRVRRTPRL